MPRQIPTLHRDSMRLESRAYSTTEKLIPTKGFNIKANDYRLIAVVQYENGVMMIRFFGSHEEYDQVDAETV